MEVIHNMQLWINSLNNKNLYLQMIMEMKFKWKEMRIKKKFFNSKSNMKNNKRILKMEIYNNTKKKKNKTGDLMRKEWKLKSTRIMIPMMKNFIKVVNKVKNNTKK